MYAVIKTGGKQYKVAKDDIIRVEKLDDAAQGDVVTLGEVLMMDDGNGLKVGAPLIDGGAVAAEVIEQTRGDKIIVFKKKRRQNYRRTRGHRQDYTVLKITEIGGNAAKAARKAAPKAAEKTQAPKAEAKAEAAPAAPAKGAPAEEKTTTAKAAAPKKAAATKKAAAPKTEAKAAAPKKAPAKKPAAKKDTE